MHAFIPTPPTHAPTTLTRSRHTLPTHKRTKPRPISRMSTTTGSGTGSSAAAPQDHHAGTADWRAFRAHLVAAERASLTAHHHIQVTSPDPFAAAASVWAHRLPAVEVGSVLLARRAHKWPPAFAHLDSAVVLVTDITPAGVAGLLLNRPTRYTVGTHASVLSRVGGQFRRNVVHLGGDCSTGSLEVLHSVPPQLCKGAEQIVPGLFRGGFNSSRALVGSGIAQASDFHFFVAYSKWTWHQFRAEMGRGAWSVVSCSPAVLLGKHLETRDEKPSRLWEDIVALLPDER